MACLVKFVFSFWICYCRAPWFIDDVWDARFWSVMSSWDILTFHQNHRKVQLFSPYVLRVLLTIKHCLCVFAQVTCLPFGRIGSLLRWCIFPKWFEFFAAAAWVVWFSQLFLGVFWHFGRVTFLVFYEPSPVRYYTSVHSALSACEMYLSLKPLLFFRNFRGYLKFLVLLYTFWLWSHFLSCSLTTAVFFAIKETII